VLANVVKVEVPEEEPTDTRATADELRRLLRRTTMPRTVAARLVDRAPALWMMSERPSVLAGDLVLCHPPLAEGEVRAVARPLDHPGAFRLTVVAADRPGLLADTAAALAAERISVQSASAATWDGVALHAMNVVAPRTSAVAWDALGERLRTMADQPRPAAHYLPIGKATVTVGGEGTGRTLVEVRAPDGIGLLEAISGWFADHGVSIEAATVSTRHGMANDVFLVEGAFQPALLEAHLSWEPPRALRPRLPGAHLVGRLAALVR
jgi:[protein-PII] uridylyltransferase